MTRAVEHLDRYERLSGEYFALRIGSAHWQMIEAERLLLSVGVRASAGFTPSGGVVQLPAGQWRKAMLRAGDYVTFRRRVDGTWSVITYGAGDFERRYRRVPDAAA